MKVSCLPVSLFADINSGKMPLEQWLMAAPEMNLDGVDISMMFIRDQTAAYLGRLQKMFAECGTQVIMATSYPDFTHPDKMQRERELMYFARDIALCSQLGIPYLRVLAGQAHPETSRKDGIRWAIDGIRRSADIADHFGVKLLYEDHSKPGAWDYVDFSFPVDIFMEVMDGIWDTSVGLNFDTGNMVAYGQDPLPILKQVLPKVETIHVTDMGEFGRMSPVLIGTGVVPNRECFHYLKENGWDKWLCIEEASFTGLDGIRKAVVNTRKLWQEA